MLNKPLKKLRFLFGDDPLLVEDQEGNSNFTEWFDVETDYENIVEMARRMMDAQKSDGCIRRVSP